MFKKIKLPALFIIISIYTIGVILTFSGDLIIQIQNVRHSEQIKRVNEINVHEFSLIEWNAFSDKKEINYKGKYYDVVSFEQVGTIIVAKMVHDDFENEFRFAFSQIFNAKKIPESQKKKTIQFSYHIFERNYTKKHFWITSKASVELNFKSNFKLKTNSYINLPLKPPSI